MRNMGALLCVMLLVSTGAFARKEKADNLHFEVDKDWKFGTQSEIPGADFTEMIREGDDIDNWKELLTIQSFRKTSGFPPAEDMLAKLKDMRETKCPGQTEWNVIEQKKDSILYEWHVKSCLGQPQQSEIARIIYGKHNVFVLHYAAKVPEFPPDVRSQWIQRLNSAEIRPPD